jgi:FAD/FMN-containing dehydrogenase
VTLGGGVGRFQGLHGLIIDALISLKVITAKGNMIKVNRASNPDLFWAMRVAGANIGNVTSATYKMKPLTNNGNILRAVWIIRLSLVDAYFAAIASFKNKLPAKLASISVMLFNPETQEV